MGLWDLYARCYDAIARLEPYRRMLGDLVGAVPAAAPPGRVLDAGCGTGNVTRALLTGRPDVGEVVAADLSAAMLSRARRKNPGVTHVRADLDGDLSEVAGSFDLIVCGNVLYAVADPKHTAGVLKSRLNPGGRLVVTTPRVGAGTGRILGDHVRERGVASLLPVIVPLVLVGLINARLLRNAAHHFLTREELSDILGTDDIRTTYSDEAWLAVYVEGAGPADPQAPHQGQPVR